MFGIGYSKDAVRSLRRMPANRARQIMDRISKASGDPFADPQITRLAGREEYRLRVGDWRVLLQIDAANRTISVIDVLPRGRAYR